VGDPEAAYKIAQADAVLGDKVSALRVFKRSIDSGFPLSLSVDRSAPGQSPQ
jgi:hypothetical protein